MGVLKNTGLCNTVPGSSGPIVPGRTPHYPHRLTGQGSSARCAPARGWAVRTAVHAASPPSRVGRECVPGKCSTLPPPGVIPQAAGRRPSGAPTPPPPLRMEHQRGGGGARPAPPQKGGAGWGVAGWGSSAQWARRCRVGAAPVAVGSGVRVGAVVRRRGSQSFTSHQRGPLRQG